MNRRRQPKVIGVAVGLTLVMLALMPVGVFAKHGAIVSNGPLGAKVNTLTTFTLSVTNDPAVPGAKPINKVELVVDSDWTASATQPTPPTGWSVGVVGNTITWTGSEIPVGGTEYFDWKATTAASAEYSTHSWTTTDTINATNNGTVGTVVSDWESYNDAGHTTVDNYFEDGENTVYMFGGGFEASTAYHIGYYDGSDAWVVSEGQSSTSGGELSGQCYFPTYQETAVEGTWHAVVYKDPTPPPETGYIAGDPNSVAEDSFDVTAGAIPEFPTAIAAIAAAGMCFGIYYWMRKRRLAHVKA